MNLNVYKAEQNILEQNNNELKKLQTGKQYAEFTETFELG